MKYKKKKHFNKQSKPNKNILKMSTYLESNNISNS